jgi:hypothetical protein
MASVRISLPRKAINLLRGIPRGVEVLIKKAAVDPAFKKTLLAKRSRAADDIALNLEPAEAAMLDAVPEEQLRAIIGRTKVSPNLRPAFLGAVAAAMLAALAASGCKEPRPEDDPIDRGIDPDYPEDPYAEETAATADAAKPPATAEVAAETALTAEEENTYGPAFGTGIRPDIPSGEGE